MNDQNGYIKDEDLPTLTTPELVEKIRTARKIWRDDQKTIESLTDQYGAAAKQIEEKDAQLAELESLLNEAAIGAEETESQIAELEIRVANYQERLQEIGDQAMEAWCKAGKAYATIKPFHNTED